MEGAHTHQVIGAVVCEGRHLIGLVPLGWRFVVRGWGEVCVRVARWQMGVQGRPFDARRAHSQGKEGLEVWMRCEGSCVQVWIDWVVGGTGKWLQLKSQRARGVVCVGELGSLVAFNLPSIDGCTAWHIHLTFATALRMPRSSAAKPARLSPWCSTAHLRSCPSLPPGGIIFQAQRPPPPPPRL
jgi:hypothetical protein